MTQSPKAPTGGKNHRYQLTPQNISYLSTLQPRYHVAKKNKTTAQLFKVARRSIAEQLKERDGVSLSKVEKQKIEHAVELYFRRTCGRRGRIEKTGTRNRSAREVFAAENEAEVKKKQAELESQSSTTQSRIGIRQRAITALWEGLTLDDRTHWQRKAIEWNNVAPPMDVRLRNADNTTMPRIWAFAQDLYRQTTVRLWGYALYRDAQGRLVVQSIDFNDRLDNAPRAMDALPDALDNSAMRTLMEAYGRVLYSPPNPNASTIPPHKTSIHTSPARESSRVTLEKNLHGEPLLPDPWSPPPTSDVAKWRIKLFRTYLSEHYGLSSGQTKENPTLPWAAFVQNPRQFVPSTDHLPDRYIDRLEEPYTMSRADINNLLSYWYQRQLDGCDPVFEFTYFVDTSSESGVSPRQARKLAGKLATSPADQEEGSAHEGGDRGELSDEGDNGSASAGEDEEVVQGNGGNGVGHASDLGGDGVKLMGGGEGDESGSWGGIDSSDDESWTGCGMEQLASGPGIRVDTPAPLPAPDPPQNRAVKSKSSSPALPPAMNIRPGYSSQDESLAVPDWKSSPLKSRPTVRMDDSSEESSGNDVGEVVRQALSVSPPPQSPDKPAAPTGSDEVPYFPGPKSAQRKRAAKKQPMVTPMADDSTVDNSTPIQRKKRNEPTIPVPLTTRGMKQQERRQTRSMVQQSTPAASTSANQSTRPKPKPRPRKHKPGPSEEVDDPFEVNRGPRRRVGGSSGAGK